MGRGRELARRGAKDRKRQERDLKRQERDENREYREQQDQANRDYYRDQQEGNKSWYDYWRNQPGPRQGPGIASTIGKAATSAARITPGKPTGQNILGRPSRLLDPVIAPPITLKNFWRPPP